MKYECGSCNALMALQGVEGAAGGVLRIAFRCPNCSLQIFLIANPHEAQLVKSMGITLGGREGHRPLGLVRSTLEGLREELSPSRDDPAGKDELEERPVWDVEAEQRLDKAPAPIREMARVAIERYAQRRGHRRITPQIVAEARENLGM